MLATRYIARDRTMIQTRHPLIHPFSGWDMSRLVDARAEDRGQHPFLIWEPFRGNTRIWSYAQFAHDTRRIGAGLARRGIEPGDKVLLHFDNCPETVLAWYACARIGAVAVTTNARSAGPELDYFAKNSQAVAAITQPRFAELVSTFCKDIRWIAVSDHDAGESPASTPPSGADSFNALFDEADDCPAVECDPSREISIQYTSGTTSRPKGVVWTHANALWGFRVNALHTGTQASDVHIVHMPLFHTNAQSYSLGASLYAGASCVIMPRFSASRFWSVSLEHRCTIASMIPFCERALKKQEVPPAHFYRLWGNAVCEPPTDALFRVRTIGWWGMTETMTHGIVGDLHHRNQSLMIGKAAPEYSIAVLREDGTPTDPGEVGQLRVLGVPGLSLFKEYLHNPAATTEAYDEQGWFRTGDQVILHEDGYIQFSDRDKDMLKVGGENVAASEIERVVLALPEIEETAVVARKDPMRDEVPVIFVLAVAGATGPTLEQKILTACRTELADFKVPREVFFVDDFPRSTLEKIAKAKLREEVERNRQSEPEGR